jgi:hypothetical protein
MKNVDREGNGNEEKNKQQKLREAENDGSATGETANATLTVPPRRGRHKEGRRRDN